MFKKNPLSFVAEQLSQRAPEALQPLQDVGKRFLQEQAPFISRAEFEAQQRLLEQALEKLNALEQKLAAKEGHP